MPNDTWMLQTTQTICFWKKASGSFRKGEFLLPRGLNVIRKLGYEAKFAKMLFEGAKVRTDAEK
jgi:hypothetical protein